MIRAAALLLVLSCDAEPEPACVDLLAACEFRANRSSDIVTYWIALYECSYDYGACVSSPETQCDQDCRTTYVRSACEIPCWAGTSTAGLTFYPAESGPGENDG